MIGGSVYLMGRKKAAVRQKEIEEEKKEKVEIGPEPVEHLLMVDPLELEVGYGLIPLVDREQGGEFLDRVRSIRRQFALEMGLVVPPIHIRDNLQLNSSEYHILLKGIKIEFHLRCPQKIGNRIIKPVRNRCGITADKGSQNR